jgi:hypothetical protein
MMECSCGFALATYARWPELNPCMCGVCSTMDVDAYLPRKVSVCVDCSEKPEYGNIPGYRERCGSHKLPHNINARSMKCQSALCKKTAGYRHPDSLTKTGTHCKTHAGPDFINRNPKCKFEGGCNVSATMRADGKTTPEYCSKHAPAQGYSTNDNRLCTYPECGTRASYGTVEGEGLRCVKHKDASMHNTISRVCIHKGCETQPNHYDESGNKVYCAKHAPSGSYAAYKKCGYVGCETVPTFGLPGGKREFCKAHKSDCHVDLNNPVCAGDNCLKQAKFGPVGGKPIYCVKHSQPNHRNLACKVCEHPDCDTQPTYGYLDEKRTHCMLHALDGMSPVIKRRCEVLDCHARATCGLLYGKKAHCAEHKLDAEYANNHPRCIVDSCRGDAYFAPNVGEYPTYCDQHGDRYVDVVRVTWAHMQQRCCAHGWYMHRLRQPATYEVS